VRLALESGAPIVPVAVIGSEETYPAIHNAKRLAKLFGAPYLPVTPFWPFMGLLGAVPLPVKIDLYFGEPIHLEGDPDASDKEIRAMVAQVRDTLQGMIDAGLAERPDLQAFEPLRKVVVP
jgi:1-acyl-sn-glycerol-3-phosphate acyltransferase